jgi:hypothetical protein
MEQTCAPVHTTDLEALCLQLHALHTKRQKDRQQQSRSCHSGQQGVCTSARPTVTATHRLHHTLRSSGRKGSMLAVSHGSRVQAEPHKPANQQHMPSQPHQGVILCDGVVREPATLCQGVHPQAEVGTCARDIPAAVTQQQHSCTLKAGTNSHLARGIQCSSYGTRLQ